MCIPVIQSPVFGDFIAMIPGNHCGDLEISLQ
jgi:hypothetical protein